MDTSELANLRHPVILIVDDDAPLRNLLRKFLQKDYEILSAASGSEALELARLETGNIDILLSDIEMPGMDGVSLCHRICGERPKTRVLLMSGGSVVAPLDRAGLPLPFVAKPFELRKVQRLLRELLAEPALTPEDRSVILVVDDEVTRREHIHRILTENGYSVRMASNLGQAQMLSDENTKIDLVIAAVMSDGSGVRLAEHIDASTRPVSTLLISHYEPEALQEMTGFSAQPEYLPNPFTPEELLKRVGHLLRKKDEATR
jgi:DNA-binding response OmpR family regulator